MNALKAQILEFIEANLCCAFDLPVSAHVHLQSFIKEIQVAHHYPLQAGGKRIRPLFVFLVAYCLGGEAALEKAQSVAMAVEYVHTYSLVHDDLPCMDNDDLRRGKATTHKIYGEAKGLLVGDGLLNQAYYLLSQVSWGDEANLCAQLVETLSRAAGATGMVLGQWLDISLENKPHLNLSWQEIQCIHNYKTGYLLGASLELGLICGWSQRPREHLVVERKRIKHIGVTIGLAFQIIDDILDEKKSTKELGKTAGKDKIQKKATAVSTLGLEGARDLAKNLTFCAIEDLKIFFTDKVEPMYNDGLQALLMLTEELLLREY